MARGGLEDWAGLKARQEEKKWRLHNLEANCKTLHLGRYWVHCTAEAQ